MSTSAAALELADLHIGYGSTRVITGMDLVLRASQSTAILGANGAGKTTLLKGIMGIAPIEAGEVCVAGRSVTVIPPWERVSAGLSLVPEGRRIFGSLSVEENLVLATRRYERAKADDVDDVFELFPEIARRRRLRASGLSGGEQQMLAIGRALVQRPSVMMIDEMTMGLAPRLRSRIVEVIGRIRREQPELSLLLVDQHPSVALAVSDSFIVLRGGRIAASGASADAGAERTIRDCILGGERDSDGSRRVN